MRSASNLPPSTTWLPASNAVIVQMNGPLWYSGPGIRCVPSSVIPSSGVASGSMRLAWFARISFGRPVEPPDVIALYGFDTASGNGPASNASTCERTVDDDAGPRELDDRVELALRQASRDGLRDGAELPARDRRGDELGAVRQRDRHDVVLADALRRERPRRAVRERSSSARVERRVLRR